MREMSWCFSINRLEEMQNSCLDTGEGVGVTFDSTDKSSAGDKILGKPTFSFCMHCSYLTETCFFLRNKLCFFFNCGCVFLPGIM